MENPTLGIPCVQEYRQDLQAALDNFLANSPTLEVLEAVEYLISEAHLDQIKDEIKAKRQIQTSLVQPNNTVPVTDTVATSVTPGPQLDPNSSDPIDALPHDTGSVPSHPENEEPMPLDRSQSNDDDQPPRSQHTVHAESEEPMPLDRSQSNDDDQPPRSQHTVHAESEEQMPLVQSHDNDDGQPPRSQHTVHAESEELLSLVPDDIIKANYKLPYDQDWVPRYNVSDAQVQRALAAFPAVPHFRCLFIRGVLKVGDIFRVPTVQVQGRMIERFVTVHSLGYYHQGFHYPCLQIIDHPLSPQIICRDAQEMMQAIRNFHGPIGVPDYRTVWDSVSVIRRGSQLGSIGAVRDRYTVWKKMVEFWASKDNFTAVLLSTNWMCGTSTTYLKKRK